MLHTAKQFSIFKISNLKMSDNILDLLTSGSEAKRNINGASSSSYFAKKYVHDSGNMATNVSSFSGYGASLGIQRESAYNETTDAPLDLMNKFLLCITENRMTDALELCDQILEFEPTNKIILEYKPALREYIAQGLDQEEKSEQSESEGKESEAGSSSEGEENEQEQSDNENESNQCHYGSTRKK